MKLKLYIFRVLDPFPLLSSTKLTKKFEAQVVKNFFSASRTYQRLTVNTAAAYAPNKVAQIKI